MGGLPPCRPSSHELQVDEQRGRACKHGPHAETHDAVIPFDHGVVRFVSAATDVSCASHHLTRWQRERDDRLLPDLLDHEHDAPIRLRTCFVFRRIGYDQA